MSLDRYLTGDDSAFDDAVVECLPLVDQVVEKLLDNAPGFKFLEDDLQSEGYVSLIKAIPTMRKSVGARSGRLFPKTYLRKAIKSICIDVINKENHLGMSRRTWMELTKNDAEIASQAEFTEEHFSSMEDAQHTVNLAELRETIYDCCHSAEERLIVDMREQGFTFREVSQELGMSLDTVHKYLNSVYSRLQQELQS